MKKYSNFLKYITTTLIIIVFCNIQNVNALSEWEQNWYDNCITEEALNYVQSWPDNNYQYPPETIDYIWLNECQGSVMLSCNFEDSPSYSLGENYAYISPIPKGENMTTEILDWYNTYVYYDLFPMNIQHEYEVYLNAFWYDGEKYITEVDYYPADDLSFRYCSFLIAKPEPVTKKLFVFIEGAYSDDDLEEDYFTTHAEARVKALIASSTDPAIKDMTDSFDYINIVESPRVGPKGREMIDQIEQYIEDNSGETMNIIVAAHSAGAVAAWNYKDGVDIPEDEDVNIDYIYYDAPYNQDWSQIKGLKGFFPKLFWRDLRMFTKARKEGISDDENYKDWTEGYPRPFDTEPEYEWSDELEKNVKIGEKIARNRQKEHTKFRENPEVLDFILDEMIELIESEE